MLREDCPIRLAVDVTSNTNNDLSTYMEQKGIKHTSDALRMIIKAQLDKELGRID